MGTGLNPGTWMMRIVQIRDTEGHNNGRLVYRGITPEKLSQYEPDFFDMLYQVQASSDHISNSKNLVQKSESAGMLSFHQAPVHHTYQSIPPRVVYHHQHTCNNIHICDTHVV